jgi:magnesium transporter
MQVTDTATAPAAADDAPISMRAAAQEGHSCLLLDQERALQYVDAREGLIWVDILVRDLDVARKFLTDKMGFHELVVEDALSEDERPTLQEFSDYIFFSLPALRDSRSPDTFVEIGFFLKSHSLVTVRTQPATIVDEWFQRWKNHPEAMEGSPAMLLHSIMDGIVDAFFPVVDHMEDAIDELSDSIFGGDTGRVKDILVLKRRFLELRRRMSPVREILNALLRRDLVLVPVATKPYFQDVLDHVIRIGEVLDMNRETLAALLDVHLSQVSNNLNLVVKKMTVVATILMVMTLIAGIYGMNFRFMPELDWRMGYPFALALMALSGALTLWAFRRSKWI